MVTTSRQADFRSANDISRPWETAEQFTTRIRFTVVNGCAGTKFQAWHCSLPEARGSGRSKHDALSDLLRTLGVCVTWCDDPFHWQPAEEARRDVRRFMDNSANH